MVRDNIVKGDLNKEKMTDLASSLRSEHQIDNEMISSLSGFDTSKDLYKHLVTEKKKSDDSVEQAAHDDRAKGQLQVLDDLSLVLNTLFTKHGHTVIHGYMTFMWGGKIHTMIECDGELREQVDALTSVAEQRKVDINLLLTSVLKDNMPPILTSNLVDNRDEGETETDESDE
jgi:hypothetical protein